MSISVNEIISFIPENKLDELAAETKVDKKNTYKLKGKAVFQFLLYSLIEEDRISLRVLENTVKKQKFKFLYKGNKLDFAKSGLSDRLKIIPVNFFEKILNTLVVKSNFYLKAETDNIKRFDSTIITLSSKLLKCGYPVSYGKKQQIKFSIGFDKTPFICHVHNTNRGNSEEVALKEVINDAILNKDDIVVFDRGLTARDTLTKFNHSSIKFVTRLSDRANYKVIRKLESVNNLETDTLILLEDNIVILRSYNRNWIQEEFRLVKAITKKESNIIYFLTNVFDINAIDVTEIYKKRWDIEVFFKFIKQYLNAKHFLSRDLNGITVVFYMILIASLMLLLFKQLNKIKELYMSKRDFREEIRNMILYEIIIYFQTYPDKLKKEDFYLNFNSGQ